MRHIGEMIILMKSDILKGPLAVRYIDVRAWEGTAGTTTGVVPSCCTIRRHFGIRVPINTK